MILFEEEKFLAEVERVTEHHPISEDSLYNIIKLSGELAEVGEDAESILFERTLRW